jgi:hypothetical protein
MRERVTIRGDDEWRACLSDATREHREDRATIVRQVFIDALDGSWKAGTMLARPHD